MPKREQLRQAIKILNDERNRGYGSVGPEMLSDSIEAVLELAEQDWTDYGQKKMPASWREGYEQCLTDIVDAVADEWGVIVWVED